MDASVATLPAQSLLVVDEAEVSRLADQSGGAARVHAGLVLLRHQQPEGAERGPDGGRRHVGRPAQSRGVRQGHKQGSGSPAGPGRARSGDVGWDEERLRGAEVLQGPHVAPLGRGCRPTFDITH